MNNPATADERPRAGEGAPERVLVAMSGGVDSSVAALLLCRAGYEATGTTCKLFGTADIAGSEADGSAGACAIGSDAGAGIVGESTCCSTRDIEDARSVAFGLGMDYFVFNYQARFARDVIDRFCDGYLRGETPNPCIDCNRYIKFEALQKRRAELGFDYVATGHYARRAYCPETGRYLLKRGLDEAKDQSYVLYHLTQDTLAHMLFPLGELTKPQVREEARAAGFMNAEKSESQDICFVPDGDYAAFIGRRRGHAFGCGPIVNVQGKVLGQHAGIDRYTIGQRKGLGVAAGEPLFVLRKDAATNTLVVGTDTETRTRQVAADDVNLISVPAIEKPLRVTAKTHYRMKAQPALAWQDESGRLRVEFDEPQRTAAPGQALVLYDGDVVVGGGTIVSA